MPDRNGDRQLLAAMKSYGADLTKPAHTVHYLYFKSMESAGAAAAELQAAGYENLRVHRSPSKNFWQRLFGPREYSCIAETHAVPSESGVFATSDLMASMAEKFGGVYDGWEASVEK